MDLLIDSDILIPVVAQNQPAWMALRIETPLTLIEQSGADRLQVPSVALKPHEFYGITVGNRRSTRIASVESLTIGDFRIPKTEFFVDPRSHAAKTVQGRPVLGSFGMDVLWPVDFELDLAQKRLTFYSQDHCPGHPAHWTGTFGRLPIDLTAVGNVYFTIDVEGQKVESSIATSSEATFMTADAARQLFGFDEHSPGVSAHLDASGRPDAFFRSMSLRSGDLAIPDARVLLSKGVGGSCKLSSVGSPDGASGYDECYGVYPLVLGRNEIQGLRLYFSTKEKLIYFTTADASRQAN